MSMPIYDVTVPPGVEAFNLEVERGLVVHGVLDEHAIREILNSRWDGEVL